MYLCLSKRQHKHGEKREAKVVTDGFYFNHLPSSFLVFLFWSPVFPSKCPSMEDSTRSLCGYCFHEIAELYQKPKCQKFYFNFKIIIIIIVFLSPYPQHMEVPKLGVKLEL